MARKAQKDEPTAPAVDSPTGPSKAIGANCPACPFKDQPVAHSHPRPGQRLAIISKHPGLEEVQGDDILIGNTGRKIRKACKTFGVDLGQTQFNNLLLCQPFHKATAADINKAIECCKPRLANDLVAGGVRAVLCADKKVNQQLTGKMNEKDWFGAPLPGRLVLGKGKSAQTLWEGQAMPAFQPAQAFHKPSLWTVFYVCLDRAWQMAQGKLPAFVPGRVVIGHGKEVEAALRELEAASLLGVDIENLGDALTAPITAIGIASRDLWVSVDWTQASPALKLKVKRLLEGPARKVLHNGAFDILGLETMAGIRLAHFHYDTMLMHTAVAPDLPHGLGYVAATLFHAKRWKAIWGDFKDAKGETGAKRWEKVDDELLTYNAWDSGMTLLICEALLADHLTPRSLKFAQTLRDLSKLAMKQQRIGVKLDTDKVQKHWVNLGARARRQKKRLRFFAWKCGFGKVGRGQKRRLFNVDSNDDIRELFFEVLKAKPLAWSAKTGQPTLGDDQLRKYLFDEDVRVNLIARALMRYRAVSVLRRNTVRKMMGRDFLHPTCKVNGGGATGRVSYKPAMQNWEKSLRDMIVARPGYYLMSFDKKQLEARIGAGINKEHRLLAMLDKGWHPYKVVQAKIFGEKSLTSPNHKVLYKLSKIGFLASVYLAQPRTAWTQMIVGMPDMQLKDVIRFQTDLFTQFPRLKQGPLERIRQAVKDGYVEIPGSHHRYYFYGEPPSPNVCANVPVQGFAAHCMNTEWLILGAWADWVTHRILLQIHDDLTWETKRPVELWKKVEEVQNGVVDFENGIKMSLPVEGSIGLNWKPRVEVPCGDHKKYDEGCVDCRRLVKNPLGMAGFDNEEQLLKIKERLDASRRA